MEIGNYCMEIGKYGYGNRKLLYCIGRKFQEILWYFIIEKTLL